MCFGGTAFSVDRTGRTLSSKPDRGHSTKVPVHTVLGLCAMPAADIKHERETYFLDFFSGVSLSCGDFEFQDPASEEGEGTDH